MNVQQLRKYLEHRYKILDGVNHNDLIAFVSLKTKDYREDQRRIIKIIDYARVSGLGFSYNNITINSLEIPNQQNIIAIYKPSGNGFVRYAHRKGIRWVKDKIKTCRV